MTKVYECSDSFVRQFGGVGAEKAEGFINVGFFAINRNRASINRISPPINWNRASINRITPSINRKRAPINRLPSSIIQISSHIKREREHQLSPRSFLLPY